MESEYTNRSVLVFYDLETFGTDVAFDRISECAAVVTDDAFDLVEEPTELRCKPPLDYLPHPEACIVTGISPLTVEESGIDEPEFARAVHGIVWRDTSVSIIGYNNASFDDQFLRHLFYRTFHEPYKWQIRNTSIDLLAIVPALFDFHRDAFVWPRDEDGRPSFKLEALVEANGLQAGTSHEALSDTFALRNLAKGIHDRVPEVWEWLPTLSDKNELKRRCTVAGEARDAHSRLLIYSTPVIKREERSTTIVTPVCADPRTPGNNQWWLLDLARAVADIIYLTEDEIAERLAAGPGAPGSHEFWRSLFQVRVNRFPMLVPATDSALTRLDLLGVSTGDAVRRAESVAASDIAERLRSALLRVSYPSDQSRRDADGDLYHAFPPDAEATAREMLRSQSLEWLRYQQPGKDDPAFPRFSDARYRELLWRFRARYLPETLTADETRSWKAQARRRLSAPPNDRILGLESFSREWQQSRDRHAVRGRLSERNRRVLLEVMEHRNRVARWLALAEQAPVL